MMALRERTHIIRPGTIRGRNATYVSDTTNISTYTDAGPRRNCHRNSTAHPKEPKPVQMKSVCLLLVRSTVLN